MSIVGLLLVIAVIAVVIVFREIQRNQRAEADRRDGVVAVFSGLRLTRYGELIVGYGPSPIRHSVTGMTARCETSGSVNRVKGKRVDDRSVTLIIEGPGFVMAREVPMRHKSAAGVNAQVFASQVTAAGQHSYPAAPRPEPAALPSSGWTGNASAPGSGAQGGWPRADSPEVLFNRGIQFQQHGDLLAAQDAYRRAVASGHPEAAPLAALNLGVLLGQQGHVAGAEALFRIAIDSYHRNAGPLAALNLGDLLWDRGDTSGAKAAYQQAVYSNHHRAASKAADRLAGLP